MNMTKIMKNNYILSGKFFEAVLASEEQSDLANGFFVLANNPFLPLFGIAYLGLFASLNSLAGED